MNKKKKEETEQKTHTIYQKGTKTTVETSLIFWKCSAAEVFQFDQAQSIRGAHVNGERGHKLIEYFRALSMPFIVWVSPGWVSFAAGSRKSDLEQEQSKRKRTPNEIRAGSWFYLFIYSTPSFTTFGPLWFRSMSFYAPGNLFEFCFFSWIIFSATHLPGPRLNLSNMIPFSFRSFFYSPPLSSTMLSSSSKRTLVTLLPFLRFDIVCINCFILFDFIIPFDYCRTSFNETCKKRYN